MYFWVKVDFFCAFFGGKWTILAKIVDHFGPWGVLSCPPLAKGLGGKDHWGVYTVK